MSNWKEEKKLKDLCKTCARSSFCENSIRRSKINMVTGYCVKYSPKTYIKTCPDGHTTTLDNDMKEKYCYCGLEYECSMDTNCLCDDCKKENIKMD